MVASCLVLFYYKPVIENLMLIPSSLDYSDDDQADDFKNLLFHLDELDVEVGDKSLRVIECSSRDTTKKRSQSDDWPYNLFCPKKQIHTG